MSRAVRVWLGTETWPVYNTGCSRLFLLSLEFVMFSKQKHLPVLGYVFGSLSIRLVLPLHVPYEGLATRLSVCHCLEPLSSSTRRTREGFCGARPYAGLGGTSPAPLPPASRSPPPCTWLFPPPPPLSPYPGGKTTTGSTSCCEVYATRPLGCSQEQGSSLLRGLGQSAGHRRRF